jgi:transposase
VRVIGEDRSQRLDVIPAQYQVIVTRRPKYACRRCQEAVVQATAPARLIAGGLPTEQMVAHVVVAKYADHCPLYRQAQILARQGIAIDRATLAYWVGYAAAEIKPLWRLMREELLRSTKLFVDETTAPVLDPGRGRTKTGYLWVLARDDRPCTAGCGVQLRPWPRRRTCCSAPPGLRRRASNRRVRRLPQSRRSQAHQPAGHARVLLGTLAQAVADSGGSRSRIRDDVAHHSDLMSLGVPR